MRLRLLSGLSPALLLACEPSATCPPGRCGTLIFAAAAEPTTLNPALATRTEERDVHDQIFEKLADIGPDLVTVGDSGFEPRLAASWERRDSLTLVFHLRPDARWHNGVPVRASDVEFSFDAYIDPEITGVIGPALGSIEAVEAHDSLTVVIRFTRPYGAQFYDAVYHMRILPAHLLDTVPRAEWPQASFSRAPIGSGPYRFVRWDAGERIVLEADTAAAGEPPPVTRLIFRPLGDRDAIVSALLAQEVDATDVMMFGPFHERLAAAAHLQPVAFESPAYGFYAFNTRDPGNRERPHAILADLRVRQALVRAVDRAALVQAVLDTLGRAGVGPHTKLQWMWSPDLFHLPYDTAAAAAQLREAGWIDSDDDGLRERAGQPLRLRVLSLGTSSLRHQFALLVQDAWRRLGVETVLDEVDPATLGARGERGDFDVAFGSWIVDPDPSGSPRQLWTRAGFDGGDNWWRYANPEYTRLVDAATETPDVERARELWRASVEVLNRDAAALFLYELTQIVWVHQRITNPTVRPDSWWALVSTWRIDPSQALPRDLVSR